MLKIKNFLSIFLAICMIFTMSSVVVKAGDITQNESNGVLEQLAAACPTIDTTDVGYNIRNTMFKLENGLPVTICLYGQSLISYNNAWTVALKNYLQSKYPKSQITWLNIAVGSWDVTRLKKAVQYDFKGIYPDLVIFYAYGDYAAYDYIIYKIRDMCSTEVMLLTEHKAGSETDDDINLNPDYKRWSDYMSYVKIPAIARKYSAEYCDIRTPWVKYLKDNGFTRNTTAYSTGNVHLNGQGEALMFNFVKQFFVYKAFSSANVGVTKSKDLTIGKDLNWSNGKLSFKFTGNRVELFSNSSTNATANVIIDGKKPSQFSEAYYNTRITPDNGYFLGTLGTLGMRTLYGIDILSVPKIERLTLTTKNMASTNLEFDLVGSVSGNLGSGKTGISIATADDVKGNVTVTASNPNYFTAQVSGVDTYEVQYENFRLLDTSVLNGLNFITDIKLDGTDKYTQTQGKVVAVSGLSNVEHTVEIVADNLQNVPQIKSIRIYNPSAQSGEFPYPTVQADEPESTPTVAPTPAQMPTQTVVPIATVSPTSKPVIKKIVLLKNISPVKLATKTTSISGITTALATVKLYSGNKVIKAVKADKKGKFKFSKLKLKKYKGKKLKIVALKVGYKSTTKIFSNTVK